MPVSAPTNAHRPLTTVRYFGVAGPVWTTVLVLAAGILLLLVGFMLPTVVPENLPAKLAAIGVAGSLLVALVVLRDRTPTWMLWGIQFMFVIASATLMTTSPTDAGSLSFMVGLVSASVYAGLWGNRRMAVVVVSTVVVAGTVALAVADRLSSLAVGWVAMASLSIGIVVVIQVLVRALERQVLMDPLTGVLNRRGLHSAVGPMSPRRDENAVIMLDVDGFKGINDEIGHAEGDLVLSRLADVWSNNLRRHDTLARLGGDEFVLVLPGLDTVEADVLVARLLALSEHPWSYGIAIWRLGADFDDALESADANLRHMKRLRASPR